MFNLCHVKKLKNNIFDKKIFKQQNILTKQYFILIFILFNQEMKLSKYIFTGFLSIAFATTSVFAYSNCDENIYRYQHTTECKTKESNDNSIWLALAGGAALVGVGVALASQSSNHSNSSSTAPTITNPRIASVTYSDYFPNTNDIDISTINTIKSGNEYQRNFRQYNAIDFAYASARGFSGKNVNIAILDDFQTEHGYIVHDILHNIAHDANITNTSITTSGNNFTSFDNIANIIATNAPAHIYNASWQISSTLNNNAATAIYNGNSVKTYTEAQSYMYNITSENFINQIRNTAVDNDAVFVFAAGNDSQNESGALSALPLAFPDLSGHFVNVVALDNYGNIAWYSNQCGITQNYCISAPGSGWNTDTKDYASGTSFAAPTVSGAIATIKEAFPYMSATEITQLLFVTATDLGDPGVDSVYGWGLLNMDRATKPIGTPHIVLSNETIQPLDNMTVSGIAGSAIKNANIKIAFVDDFGRAFTTKLSDKINIIPYGRGFDKLRESDQDSFVFFDTFEFGFKQNNLLESFGLMSVQSNKLTNFVGYRNEFDINDIQFYQNARIGITNPTTDNNDNSIVSGFSNIYTVSAKIGAKYKELSFEIAIPETIISGDMYLNIPVARANNGQMVYSNIGIDLTTRSSLEYSVQYKYLSASYVINPLYENEFFVMAKTKLTF